MIALDDTVSLSTFVIQKVYEPKRAKNIPSKATQISVTALPWQETIRTSHQSYQIRKKMFSRYPMTLSQGDKNN